MVSGQSFGSSTVGLACVTSMCSVQRFFPGGHSLCLAFGSFLCPHPSPFYSSRCLVSLAWGLMAGGRRFASHGGITLFRGLALPKVEAPEHPRRPPPLSDAVV